MPNPLTVALLAGTMGVAPLAPLGAAAVAEQAALSGEGADLGGVLATDYAGPPQGGIYLAQGRGNKYGHYGKEGGEGGEGKRAIIVLPLLKPAPRPLQIATACGRSNANQLVGTLLGAAAGGYVGSKFGKGSGQLAAVAGGTLLGAFIGHEIAESLTWSDAACAEQAFTNAHSVPVGRSIRWNNPETGHFGTVVPLREGTDPRTKQYCREYQTTVEIGGRQQNAYGIACQQPDGSWRIMKG